MLKKWILMAQFVGIMIIGGYVVYLISKGLPIPGGKFLLMGPFLTMVMMVLMERYPKYGTLTILNAVFAMVMFLLSPWMSVAIILSGAIGDAVMLIPVRHWYKQAVALGVYNVISLLTSVYISIYVTSNVLYGLFTPMTLVIVSGLAFVLGVVGAVLGRFLNGKYLAKVK